MKHEKWISFLIAAVLAFLLSLGGVGCLVTAFSLDGGSMIVLAFSCAFFAAVSAVCFQLKWGGTLVLCLLALASGFLWHSNDALEQLYALLYRITYLYDRAYGWGVLDLRAGGAEELTVGYPLGVLGCLVAVCASWTVCRRKGAIPAVLAALAPLLVCLVVTDTVPKEGYLYILILGLLILIFTNSLRRDSESQGNMLTLLVTGPVALALGILFLAVPQKDYVNQTVDLQKRILAWAEEFPVLWENQDANAGENSQNTVKPTEVDLKNLGPREAYSYPVMDVTGAVNGVLYLRDQDYDEYDGLGWTADPSRAEVFGGEGLAAVLDTVGTVTISTARNRELLYLPYYTLDQVELEGGRISNEGSIRSYEFTQQKLPDNWRALAEDTGDDMTLAFSSGTWTKGGGSDDRYLELPNDTRVWAKELLESILDGGESATQKADAIAAYVRAVAEYDQNTGKMPEEETDFARWFLEDAETGYCVHYATATTVLLRAAGVRARYVTGYLLRAKQGVAVTVTADQAHAWAEYYDPQLGMWIVLESTPGDLVGEEETVPSETRTGATEATGDTSIPETEGTQQRPTQGPTEGQEATSPTGGTAEPTKTFHVPVWLKHLAKTALWLAAAVFVITGQRELRLRLRRKKLRGGPVNDQALARWREAVLLYRLLKQTPPRELERLAQKARFSQHTLTAEELQVFDAHLRAARQACREKPWYARLADRYIFAAY